MRIDPFRLFRPWLRPYRRQIVLGLALLLLAQTFTLVLPLLLKEAIERAEGAARAGEGAGAVAAALGEVELYAWTIAGLALVGWGVNFGMRWFFTSVSRHVEHDIRRAYVRHLLHLPLRFFQERRAGDLMARATNDVEAIQRFLHHAFRMTLMGVLTFVMSLLLMSLIDWQLALLALAPMPVLAVAASLVSVRVRSGYRRVQDQFGAISSRIQENLGGMRVVKACAIEAREIRDFEALNDEYVERNRGLIHIRSLFFPFTGLLNGASMLVVLWLGGLRVIDGTLTLGAFVAFNLYLIRMSRPMYLLGRMVDEFQRAAASLGRINAILGHPPEDRRAPGRDGLRGEVELRDVRLAFEGRQALDGVSLRVPAGGTLAIVGRVGSGKSTLARLIPRLLEADSGEVLIDGVPVERIPLTRLRAAIGYVPQEAFLFSETIEENIVLDRAPGPVEWAAGMAQLDPAEFPDGLETVVGERGVTLSGGQRQRTALARALAREPRILILDDALASVDTATEEGILDNLRDVMRQRTTILIAHRLSSVRDADRIVVLDDGRIAEEGTHEELVARGGLYAGMHRRQSLARELTEL